MKVLETSELEFVIQVNGKLRGSILVDVKKEKDEIISAAKKNENVKNFCRIKNLLR